MGGHHVKNLSVGWRVEGGGHYVRILYVGWPCRDSLRVAAWLGPPDLFCFVLFYTILVYILL